MILLTRPGLTADWLFMRATLGSVPGRPQVNMPEGASVSSIVTTKLEGALKSPLVISSIVWVCVFGGEMPRTDAAIP